jgi:transposase
LSVSGHFALSCSHPLYSQLYRGDNYPDTGGNRAAQALRLAAGNLRQSQSSLGAYFRRLCAKMDKPKAITAAAHKLARLVYMMLTKGQGYTDAGQQYYEERYRQRVVANLARRAKDLGLQLVPVENPA